MTDDLDPRLATPWWCGEHVVYYPGVPEYCGPIGCRSRTFVAATAEQVRAHKSRAVTVGDGLPTPVKPLYPTAPPAAA